MMFFLIYLLFRVTIEHEDISISVQASEFSRNGRKRRDRNAFDLERFRAIENQTEL